MAETLTTDLDAVNAILGTIGESPVNSLLGALPSDVQSALNILNETSRAVQMDGWGFNTEYDVVLQPDISTGLITLPGNCLDVKMTTRNSQVDPVQRGLSLYDRKNHTYVFTRSLKCTLVYYLAWEELIEQARRFIMIKAARVFQSRNVGSDTLHGFTQQEEMIAMSQLKGTDDDDTDYNIFNNYDTARMIDRRH